jgi:hypothetical protein
MADPVSRIVKYGTVFLVVVGIPVIGMLGTVIYRSSVSTANASTPVVQPPPPPEPVVATAATVTPECRIKMKGSSEEVPVFPTEAGLAEYISAAVTGDNDATEVAFHANGGFFVPAATRCFRVDVGIMKTKVRVLDGDHRGETGWVPTEFTML